MELWIARDKDGDLYLYDYKPCKNEDFFACDIKPCGKWSEEYELERDLFPEVTFENSPQEIELKLVK